MVKRRASRLELFMAKVEPEPMSGCWLWTAFVRPGEGYGHFAVDGGVTNAHRYAHEVFIGQIPAGLVVDHLCGNTSCVNPDHLQAVTQRTNILRSNNRAAINARKTHCPAGHPYDGDNTRVGLRGKRYCIACAQERDARRRKPPKEQCPRGHKYGPRVDGQVRFCKTCKTARDRLRWLERTR